MALTRLTNRSVSAVTSLPSAATSQFLTAVPSGTIVQVKNYVIDASIYTDSTSGAVLWTQPEYITKAQSSYIIYQADFSYGGFYGPTIKVQYSPDNSNWYDISTGNMRNIDDSVGNGTSHLGCHTNMDNRAYFSIQTGFNHMHQPNYTQVKYRVLVGNYSSGIYATINRRGNDDGHAGLSFISFMEVKA